MYGEILETNFLELRMKEQIKRPIIKIGRTPHIDVL